LTGWPTSPGPSPPGESSPSSTAWRPATRNRFAEDNSTTFKRFSLQGDGRIRLEPLNRAYPVGVYDPEEINGLWPAVMRVEKLR